MSKPRPTITDFVYEPTTRNEIALGKAAEPSIKRAIQRSMLRTAAEFYHFVQEPDQCDQALHKKFEPITAAYEKAGIHYPSFYAAFQNMPPETFIAGMEFSKNQLMRDIEFHMDISDQYCLNIPTKLSPSETCKLDKTLTKSVTFYNALLALFKSATLDHVDVDLFNEGLKVDNDLLARESARAPLGEVFVASYGWGDINDLEKFITALSPPGMHFNFAEATHLRQ